MLTRPHATQTHERTHAQTTLSSCCFLTLMSYGSRCLKNALSVTSHKHLNMVAEPIVLDGRVGMGQIKEMEIEEEDQGEMVGEHALKNFVDGLAVAVAGMAVTEGINVRDGGGLTDAESNVDDFVADWRSQGEFGSDVRPGRGQGRRNVRRIDDHPRRLAARVDGESDTWAGSLTLQPSRTIPAGKSAPGPHSCFGDTADLILAS